MAPNFDHDEYAHRLNRLQKVFAEAGLVGAVVTTPENICYLVGHETPGYYTYQCLLVPAAGDPVLLARETEVANGQQTTWLHAIEGYRDVEDPIARTAELVRSVFSAEGPVGLEQRSWYFTPAQYHQLTDQLGPRDVVAIDDMVAELRLIKSEPEISKIREAARITNAAVLAAAHAAAPGASERDVANAAFSSLILEGSEYLGMEPFVASGPRAGTIHASWSDRKIARGEGVLIELAAAHARYHAPLMHTVWSGQLEGLAARMAVGCQEARDATIEMVRPGNTPAQAHARCREVIDDHGLLDTYRKRSGYSVGIAFAPDWGEGHILSLKETEHRPFEPGMVVHVVPTLREQNQAGFGFSGTVLVTHNGHEVLTGCPITDLTAS